MLKVRHDRRIEVAGACLHDEPLERRKAHRGVEGLTALDGRNRTPAAKLQRNETTASRQVRIERAPAAPHVLVSNSMEPVASHADSAAKVCRQRILGRDPRQAGEERGVEHGDLRHLCPPRLAGALDPAQRLRIVQRRER